MRLLAKSITENATVSVRDAALLASHLQQVHAATEQVLACTQPQQLQAIGLPNDEWKDRFRRAMLLAAAIHDLGKANDHFQGIVQSLPGRGGRPQGIRHEWLALWLFEARLCDWLRSALGHDEVGWLAVECAVTGHHPAHGRPSPPEETTEGAGAVMHVYLAHSDFRAVLGWIAQEFCLAAPPVLSDVDLDLTGTGEVFGTIRKWSKRTYLAYEAADESARRFVSAVKACLMAGDVAGSALPRQVPEAERKNWILSALARTPSTADLGDLIDRRLREDGSVRPLRPFQLAIAEQADDVTLVRAGCGTGKTLAAYHWSRTRCPGKRLYFCYPTTGTATEGFRDYLFSDDEGKALHGADLFHGRADVDLEIILGVDSDLDYHTFDDALARIESLDSWSTPIVSCTADTVLGLLQNNRRGLYAWPALVGAALVFDEIHAYDWKLFGALLRFLAELRGIPVLLMTASLSTVRLRQLRDCLSRAGRLLAEPAATPDLRELEGLPRYHWRGALLESDPLPFVAEELRNGQGKVLWVCNTVNRAMQAVAHARHQGLTPLIYHSRFRYEDRVERHKGIINAFRERGPALAVCTQVAEMSLDLSATMLVTDLAPVPSLIQRLGRLNRRARPGDATRPFLVTMPVNGIGHPSPLPYTETDLMAARKWLSAIPSQGITQAHLAATWERLAEDEEDHLDWASAWLDGGPTTEVRELREGSPGITVVMEDDLDSLVSGRKRLAQVTIPMPPPPKRMDWGAWHRFRGIPITPASTVRYAPDVGAQWNEEENL